MYSQRPIIKPALSDFDRLLEKISLLALVFLLAYSIISFAYLPDTIPIHFNTHLKVDGYGSKYFIFLLPGLAVILYAGLTLLNKYPHLFNYPVKITDTNAEGQYTLATKLIRLLKAIIIFLILYFTIQIVEAARDRNFSLNFWDIPLIILLIILPTINFIIQSRKAA